MTASTVLSDRELDAWLAEHLFEAGPWCTSAGCQYDLVPSDPHWHDEAHYEGQHPRMYSSIGNGMLLVLEAMRERKWDKYPDIGATSGEDEWHVRYHETASASNVSLPRAVAEAAKAALEA